MTCYGNPNKCPYCLKYPYYIVIRNQSQKLLILTIFSWKGPKKSKTSSKLPKIPPCCLRNKIKGNIALFSVKQVFRIKDLLHAQKQSLNTEKMDFYIRIQENWNLSKIRNVCFKRIIIDIVSVFYFHGSCWV